MFPAFIRALKYCIYTTIYVVLFSKVLFENMFYEIEIILELIYVSENLLLYGYMYHNHKQDLNKSFLLLEHDIFVMITSIFTNFCHTIIFH